MATLAPFIVDGIFISVDAKEKHHTSDKFEFPPDPMKDNCT